MAFMKASENYTVTIPTERYLQEYRDADRFIGFCKECSNYGKSWSCPPFDKDWTPELKKYEFVSLYLTKIYPQAEGLSINDSQKVMRSDRERMERELREIERQSGGLAFAFAGTCLYCPEGTCSRKQGSPCRHPELVRPALEAVGFDMSKTAEELFHVPIQWSTDGSMPEYLTLICGVFHN